MFEIVIGNNAEVEMVSRVECKITGLRAKARRELTKATVCNASATAYRVCECGCNRRAGVALFTVKNDTLSMR